MISEINHDSLETAIDLTDKSDAKIVLLSDAVYMLNDTGMNLDQKFYALKEDLDKRFDVVPSSVTLIEYGDLIDMIMMNGSIVINL